MASPFRFTEINTNKRAPSYGAEEQRNNFLNMAAAEITLLVLLSLSFWHFQDIFDQTTLAGGALLILVGCTYIIRKDQHYARIVLFFSMLFLQWLIIIRPPFDYINLWFAQFRAEYLPAVFILFDLAMVWGFVKTK